MRLFCACIFCFFYFASYSQQNLKVDYKPLKSQGTLPEIFTKPLKETIAEEISSLNKIQDSNKSAKSDLFAVSNYSIQWQITSGNTLLNDEITDYLNGIVDIILKSQPEIRKKIHVYTSKSPVVNANTFYNGTIFVDLGLVAHAANEAQLAFVLGHEIAHYLRQHSVDAVVHDEQTESASEGKSSEDVFKEKCLYSHSQESEADSVGYTLLQGTGYDINEALTLFDVLHDADLPFDMVEFNKSFFQTDHFIIPDKYMLKELAPVKDHSEKDDSESTHPNISTRKKTIAKMIDPGAKGAKNILGESRFAYIRELARFEVCRLYLRYRDYNATLYSAYVLSKKYPDNLFLAQTISKCLYAISLNHTGYLRYNKDSYLDGPIHYLEVESYPQQLYYLINKMRDSEWNIMALNYVFRKHKKFPDDKILTAISDSLFKTMYYVNALFEMPPGKSNLIINENTNKDTTSWYKHVFTDLFATDREFEEKFPKSIGHDFIIPYTPKSYHAKRFSKKMRKLENIGIVMCLKPVYLIFDDKEKQELFTAAELQQKKLVEAINTGAQNQKFQLVILDPGLIASSEVSKLNDYSVVSDWLYECSDGDDNEKLKVPIFSTNEITDLVNRYGTSHVLRTGFLVLRKEYVFFSVIYDLRENRQVYISQEVFKGKPSDSEIRSRLSGLFHDLKNGQTPARK
jgi:beta-barrel assembly-enhancing protease